MNVSSKHHFELPPEQQTIRDELSQPSAMRAESGKVEHEQSIPQRLADLAQQFGERVALTVDADNSLTYARLFEHISGIVCALNDLGIGRGDRLALMLPDGLATALAFLGVSAGDICAPVNPNRREYELATIFSDLRPKALVVESGADCAAIAVAQRNSIAIIELSLGGNNSSRGFMLHGEPLVPAKRGGFVKSADVLLAHPAVEQAAAFAVPHATLGEEVASAVVLRSTGKAETTELREFAATKLAEFKVPRPIVIVDEIPKSATGKLQRSGLAEKLAGQLNVEYVAPQSELERALAHIVAEVLGVETVGATEDFFTLGGDSLRATQVISRIRAMLNVNLSIATFFWKATVRELADEILRVMAETDGD